ncbi:TPA: hypothetical protein I3798_002058 [Enterobacter cloacae]|uniref:hypothetical protein n=1 Tax=Enterobacter cloacae TaxID=550 RepID=UPI001595A1B4|nr:hypothetical protein [Enterobacter cloacae]HCM9267902.1 hypothetical protein [Enterobacter cloacae subsp. cloacae]EJD6659376.1 hypothetical protein [Enterobacter cloacae]EKX4050645.1 hypothetical protein [Enterobacter cloacae]MCK7268273.1 hypothetical protein [Enterobacter cloacae]HAS1020746.1 hypothetical protein [Enterobacter cloacae]
MWHDGRPQHPGSEEHRFRGWQAWDHHPFTELRQVRLRENQFDNIGRSDKQQQAADDFFQRFLPPTLQHQNKEGGNAGKHRPLQQRYAKDQLETNCRTNEFGEIGCHRNDFRLDPVQPYRRARVMITDLFRQVFTGGNTQFRGKHLNQHSHQVSPDNHPQKLIAKAGPGLNIGRKIAWIDIANGSDERRSH